MKAIPKNRKEEVRVRLREHRGERYVDVRTFYMTADGETRPSPKGLTVRADLGELLADAIKQVVRQGVVDAD